MTTPNTQRPPPGICPFQAAAHSSPALPEVQVTKTTFVALSKFVVANGLTSQVKEAFRNRPHLVDGQPGFLRMEVFSPLDRTEEIWLVTHWADAGSFELWHHSHLYHQAHQGIPKGLKLVPGETEIRHFELVCT